MQIHADTEAELRRRLALLDLAGKVRLLSGADQWSTCAEPAVGLRPMVLSDGPAGVRGPVADEREPSLNLPSGSALGATWSTETARRYGRALAAEAVRKGVHVVLGPTINLHRSPRGGRHFEALAEDPLLTGRLAAAYVEGLQECGVAACPKHYVGNEYETERLTTSSQIAPRPLREVYLAAFEEPVARAGAWAVMSAYNSVNGVTMTEHDLLDRPLREEWGFDGVVVSDWAAVRSVGPAARAGQDLAMPGGVGPWDGRLAAAVRSGEVPEAAIDAKVLNLLRLAARVGALEGFDRAAATPPAPSPETTLELAVDGLVLLENRGRELPWCADAPGSIAVIGRHAVEPRSQGGGSARVIPAHVVSPLEGLRRAFPSAEIGHAAGLPPLPGAVRLPLAELTDPVTGRPGAHVLFRAGDGRTLREDRRLAAELVWTGNAPKEAAALELRTVWTPIATGRVELAIAALGPLSVHVDGEPALDTVVAPGPGQNPIEALFDSPQTTLPLDVEAGRPVELRVATRPPLIGLGVARLLVGTAVAERTGEQRARLRDEAVALAARSAAAVVVVGTDPAIESEGFDRADLRLPAGQDELVRAVAAVNPRTVVVVNAGAPVLMPWRHEVAAVLLSWFGGEKTGDAVAAVLAGGREPGGRLPTTWPAEEADVPVLDTRPLGGRVEYGEGLHIGHRGWQRAGREAGYPFGHGLGYTTWAVESLQAPETARPGEDLILRARVRNTGARPGKFVVQLYAGRPGSAVERPVRWLAGFAAGRLDPGASTEVPLTVAARSLQHWTADGWATESGRFTWEAGTSSEELPVRAQTEIVRPRDA